MDTGTCFILFAVATGLAGGLLSLWLRLPAATGAAPALEPWRALALQHGPVLVFFSVIPALLGGFGTWFVPLQIGAADPAFPRLAAASFCLTVCGLLLTLGGLLASTSGLLLLIALHVSGIAILLCSINLVATMLNMRDPDMSLGAMPLFAWSQLIAGCLAVVTVPMLMAALTVLARHGVPPAVPLQHLFGVLGYPGLCIMILPSLGLVSEIVCSLGGSPPAFRRLMIGAMAALALAGFLFWADQLLHGAVLGGGGGGVRAASILLPVLAICACWAVTLGRMPRWSSLLRRTPGLFACGFAVVLLAGGIGTLLAPDLPGQAADGSLGSDRLHYVLSIGTMFAMFAGFYYWIGKMTGRPYPERAGRPQFWLMFAGVNLAALPVPALAEAGVALTCLSMLLFALIVAVTLSRRRSVAANPWGPGAVGREWRLPSPVPHGAAA